MKPEEFEFPLSDALDVEILMHRDAHFGGQFGMMIEYYHQGGKGIHPEFQIKRIEELAEMEKLLGYNLAGTLLSGAEAEQVAKSREQYKGLRGLYEREHKADKLPLLIADLILSEEIEAEEEVQALVDQGKLAVPLLIDLLKSEEFYHPLSPGYGQAPFLAAKCLGKIGDQRSMHYLFESIGEGDSFNEKMVLKALKSVGEPAKQFLLKIVKSKPFTEQNERAALALIEFSEDPEVASNCLKLLQDPETAKDPVLSTYLILACEGLKDLEQQHAFIALSKSGKFPKMIVKDMEAISKTW